MRVALIGATGLVGSHLLGKLSDHEVLVLTRRPTGRCGFQEIVAPADDWPTLLEGRTIDAAVSALGTTWRKTPSWLAFEAIDRTAVLGFARAAKAAGAGQMISISSVGADPASTNGYLAIKGRVEQDLGNVGFGRLDILRPGLLRGLRGADRRLRERVGIAISPLANLLLRGPFDRFAAIDAELVASAAAALLGRSEPGQFVHDNRQIRELASRDAQRRLR